MGGRLLALKPERKKMKLSKWQFVHVGVKTGTRMEARFADQRGGGTLNVIKERDQMTKLLDGVDPGDYVDIAVTPTTDPLPDHKEK